MTETEKAIADFIREDVLDPEDSSFEADDDLLSTGLVSSLAAMRIVSFIEERFDIEVPEADMVIDHFISVRAMASYVEGRRAGS